MAGEDRKTARVLELLQALEGEPHRFDLFQALRRLECAFRDRPRWGEALRAADEPARLGQEPSLSFSERAVASFSQSEERQPRLSTYYFGVFGANGPLPLHLTEYARDRLRNNGDATFAHFLDIFHHRMLTLFYRAFADAEPAIARDRPSSDRFAVFVGSLIGMGLPSTRGRGVISDAAKLHYAGLLAMQTRNADGLAAFAGGLFQVPVEVEEFVGEWVDIPGAHRSQLGRLNCALGVDAIVGTRAWLWESKFRLVLGPLRRAEFERFLPGSAALDELAEVVRVYVGDELAWDLKLVLARPEWRAMALGGSQLGRDSWIGLRPETWRSAELTFDPIESRAKAQRRKGERPLGRLASVGEPAA